MVYEQKLGKTSKFSGKTALVTGASRGIGRAIAERLAADGYLIAVHFGQHRAAAEEVVAKIQQGGGQAFPVQADLGVASDLDTLFAALEDGLRRITGGTQLDILVNNAAVRAGSIKEVTPEEFEHVFRINVKAPFFIIQRALPILRNGGRIINISSSDTRIAVPEELAYTMTKRAIDALGRTLAAALGERGITVNTVAPGTTLTDMNASWLPQIAASLVAMTALGRLRSAGRHR